MHRQPRSVKFFTDYADQSDENEEVVEDAAADSAPDLVVPEDLSSLSDEDLSTLQSNVETAFTEFYGDGKNLSMEDVNTVLNPLTEAIERLRTEDEKRAAVRAEAEAAAAELAGRVKVTARAEEDDVTVEADDDEEAEPEAKEEPVEEMVASSKAIHVNLSGLRSRQTSTPAPTPNLPMSTAGARKMQDIVEAAVDVPGFTQGQGMDWVDVGRGVDRRLSAFNESAYEQANRSGRHLRQQFGVAVVRKPFEEGLTIETDNPGHVDSVLRAAVDERRLPGGSLVASGGWCAPSEVIYDLCELESRDGLFSLPEIGIARGGIRFTQGPDFSSLFSNTGFNFTEAQDIAGEYGIDPVTRQGDDTAGDKPCFKVECPPFEEQRLNLSGLCITAGLLQSRGYPEVIARTVRGALVAHDHRLSGLIIAAVADGSTPVTMPASQVGALAPLLTAIELQVEHYRDIHRLSRSTTLEAVFPFWTRGAVRADLSRRLGVDLIDVPDSRIDAWFASRGVSPQFVYNWQGLSNGVAASGATSYPTEVDFLLYVAGTWVKGGSDVITIDTLYDSVLLGQNDYTALFTEEGWLVAKTCHDSRVVTVNICPDGATAAGVAIDCDGSVGA